MNQENTRGPGLQRSCRIQDFATPGVIMRERSFMRPQSIHAVHHHQLRDNNKRRSMILANNTRGKPTLEIYRPPELVSAGVRVDGVQPMQQQQQQANKLNVHAKEFTMARANDLQTSRSSLQVNALYGAGALQHSRSSGSVLHAQLLQAGPPRAIAANQLGQSTPRVHFNLQPQPGSNGASADRKRSPPLISHNGKTGLMMRPQALMPLKRSKSLTTADALASGMAALGLATDSGDLGAFSPDIQESIDKALEDPNRVCSRTLMEVVGHVVGRAVESPRYALPAARRCIAVVEREQTETFLESLLNTCRQWYQERDKLLGQVVAGGRPRLMAFLSFLLEMYCQLRRRAIQGRGGAGGRDLLTLICRCCEDCIRQPVPSPSDTENLFFVLTYIGRDLETQLPNELEKLLSAVRDAFLNTSAAPSIRKTLLQLIELHASRWQLPGCAVLYYYPSSK